jgi:hypothetical protein
MSYTITLTNGSIFANIPDGTINTTSSMTLVGKNYAGYGQFINDDIIRLLQNGANDTAPGAPITGQLWWNSTAKNMQVYNGTAFKVISGATAASTAPLGSVSVAGDLWYDTVNAQLNVYSGAAWIIVGPAYTAGTGVTGAIPATISDGATNHIVIKLYVNDNVVGIVSKDASFTPQISIPGFTTVNPGITLATTISGINQYFQGTASNANTVGNISATGFVQTTTNQTMTGTLGILNDTGLAVGLNSDFRASVSGSNVTIQNQTTNKNLILGANISGTPTTFVTMFGANGMTTIRGTTTVNTAAGATAIVNGAGNAVGNIGSSSSYFNTIFAQATTALYADVAERFAADEIYQPGTVVELGGSAEITRVRSDASDRVFGVISTRPAFTMNGGAGDNDTHPPVAMTGRVPVMVTGVVNKGDRLISAGDGIARSAQPGEATAFNVIGRALSSKTTADVGTVEAIVTIK